MSYFIENQPWGKTLYEVIPGTQVSFTTEHQRVDFISNPHFGRMLFLDGILQSSSADEKIYHEAMVGAGMSESSSNVLIAGGAEGAVAREVLKWPGVTVQMVDWDAKLVDHCWHAEKFNISAFENKRFSYSSKDILLFCEETLKKFDTIFIDLLDIDSDEDAEQMKQILAWIHDIAEDGARIVMNIGRSRKRAKEFAGDLGRIIEILVPSFQEPWYLVKKIVDKQV